MNKRVLVALLLATALGTTACGSSSSSTAYDSGYIESASDAYYDGNYMESNLSSMEMKDMAPMEAGGSASSDNVNVEEGSQTIKTNRKLISTVNLSAETKEFDKTYIGIKNKVESLDGYLERDESYDGGTYRNGERVRRMHCNMTVRVPQAKLEEFLADVEGSANVISKSTEVKDVTLSYVDIESHVKSLRTEQDRLLEILEKAETVDDIIRVEERLSYVRYEIESYQSQLKTLDDKIDYSTVYIDLSEVVDYTIIEEEEQGFFTRLAEEFVDSLGDAFEGFQDLIIGIVAFIPYLVFIIIPLIIIFLIIRRIFRFFRGKKLPKIGKNKEKISNANGKTEINNTENKNEN